MLYITYFLQSTCTYLVSDIWIKVSEMTGVCIYEMAHGKVKWYVHGLLTDMYVLYTTENATVFYMGQSTLRKSEEI